MHNQQEFKPKPKNWKILLGVPILLGSLLFPSLASFAVDETPSPSASPSVSPSASPSASPPASVSPTPAATDVPRTSLYDIDSPTSLQVVVNKKRALNPVDYFPRGKVLIGYSWVAKPAADAYGQLKAAVSAQKLGTLCVNSGYRSFESQTAIHSSRVRALGKTAGEKLAARPGHSEHQTGLAIDVSTTQLGCRIGSFGASRASKWIAENAWQYGFIVRYPDGKTKITGYVWEPWHLRFVGVELSTEMKSKKITTLEEFFALPAAPKY